MGPPESHLHKTFSHLPERSPGGHCHTGHPVGTHAQELLLPLPCGSPSTNLGHPQSPPSWDSVATEIVPYTRLPACTRGHRAGSEDSQEPQYCTPQSSSLNTLPNAICLAPTIRPDTPSVKAAASILGHLHHILVGATPSLELRLARYP